MDQGRGLWDLLFGVSDPGGSCGLKMEDDRGCQMEVPDDFLTMLQDSQSHHMGQTMLAVTDGAKSVVNGTDLSVFDCENMDLLSNLSQELVCGDPLEVDLAALGILSEFLQVPELASSTSGSGSSDDCSSSDCASVHSSPKSVRSTSSSRSLCGDEKKELVLTREEQILLGKENLTLPKFLPLSKQDERVLKKIRRKIRNKKSAQESRRKKKVYVDQLEDQIKDIATQNKSLQKRVKDLEKENISLQAQLKTLQSLLGRTTRNINTKATGTCLMALVLSVALIMTPYGKSSSDKETHAMLASDFDAENIAPVRTRILHNLDTPPDLLPSRGIPLNKEAVTLMEGVRQVNTNSVAIEPWEEQYGQIVVPVDQITLQIKPNRSTAAR